MNALRLLLLMMLMSWMKDEGWVWFDVV